MSSNRSPSLMGTKAETLQGLSKLGYKVPKTYFFTVKEWNHSKTTIIKDIPNKKSVIQFPRNIEKER